MPRFSQSDDAFLKRAMLPRAPGCVFTPEDVELCVQNTGHDKEVIQYWARQLRWKMNSNKLPGGLDIEEYLRASPESISDKVMCPFGRFRCGNVTVKISHFGRKTEM